jgi:hypothetical protein
MRPMYNLTFLTLILVCVKAEVLMSALFSETGRFDPVRLTVKLPGSSNNFDSLL